jgi:hypothetical protein
VAASICSEVIYSKGEFHDVLTEKPVYRFVLEPVTGRLQRRRGSERHQQQRGDRKPIAVLDPRKGLDGAKPLGAAGHGQRARQGQPQDAQRRRQHQGDAALPLLQPGGTLFINLAAPSEECGSDPKKMYTLILPMYVVKNKNLIITPGMKVEKGVAITEKDRGNDRLVSFIETDIQNGSLKIQ